MRLEVRCKCCDCVVWIWGSYDPETNAVELDDSDPRWGEACEHIHVGEYEIGTSEIDDEL